MEPYLADVGRESREAFFSSCFLLVCLSSALFLFRHPAFLFRVEVGGYHPAQSSLGSEAQPPCDGLRSKLTSRVNQYSEGAITASIARCFFGQRTEEGRRTDGFLVLGWRWAHIASGPREPAVAERWSCPTRQDVAYRVPFDPARHLLGDDAWAYVVE